MADPLDRLRIPIIDDRPLPELNTDGLDFIAQTLPGFVEVFIAAIDRAVKVLNDEQSSALDRSNAVDVLEQAGALVDDQTRLFRRLLYGHDDASESIPMPTPPSLH